MKTESRKTFDFMCTKPVFCRNLVLRGTEARRVSPPPFTFGLALDMEESYQSKITRLTTVTNNE
jgi:hypothetical protein